jgi:uncharacterized Zn-binding protein involved in type VI secretion
MAQKVVRRGDRNSAGGALLAGHGNAKCNGIPIGLFAGSVSAHPPCPRPPIHCGSLAAFPGSRVVTVNGLPILRVGQDKDTCGHPRATGSGNCTTR